MCRLASAHIAGASTPQLAPLTCSALLGVSAGATAFVAGAAAALGSSVVKVPLAVCIRSVQAGIYRNVVHAASEITKAAGVRGLFTVSRGRGQGWRGGAVSRDQQGPSRGRHAVRVWLGHGVVGWGRDTLPAPVSQSKLPRARCRVGVRVRMSY